VTTQISTSVQSTTEVVILKLYATTLKAVLFVPVSQDTLGMDLTALVCRIIVVSEIDRHACIYMDVVHSVYIVPAIIWMLCDNYTLCVIYCYYHYC